MTSLLKHLACRTQLLSPFKQGFTSIFFGAKETLLPALTLGQVSMIQKRDRSHAIKRRKKTGINNLGPGRFEGQAVQEWLDWDGFGPYKYKHHNYPNNITVRDLQRRRMLAKHAEERNRVNAIFKNDILPKELRDVARQEIHKVPRDSAITRVNRRCVVTGRARGIFHQFRVSRFIFRAEADYNKVSGSQRAFWLTGVHIDP